MPDGGVTFAEWLGTVLLDAGASIEFVSYVPTMVTALQVTAAVYTMRDQQRRAEARARDQYNASLRDRYAMTRGATEARQLVLGRQRVSGPIAHVQSYGDDNESIVYCVILQADEADAIESIYFDDERVELDGTAVVGIQRREEFSIAAATATVTITTKPKAGTITAVASYGSDDVTLTVSNVKKVVTVSGARVGETGLLSITYQPDPSPYKLKKDGSKNAFFDGAGGSAATFTASGTGTDVFTLPDDPVAGSVAAFQTDTVAGATVSYVLAVAGVSGRNVTVTGAVTGRSAVTVTYQATSNPSRARVRKYLGAAGQTADASMIANLGGTWTSAHTGTGLAYLVVEADYDQDAFPSGMPAVSAIVRGLKCYDPRTSTTAWTENPALLMRAYAIHPLGGGLPTSAIDDASIIAAANVCDTATTYTVGGADFVRPRYTAGTVARAGMRPADVLNDLAQAMNGRWCMVDGKLRVWAGAYTSPVLSLDESWLHEGGGIQIQPARARADAINTVTGTFADASKDYKVLAYPKVTAAAYVTADGRELPTDMPMPAVTWAGQAQYIAACQLRYGRQGLTVKLTCNLRAYQAEPFDVVAVTLARYGWSAKPFEVLDCSYTVEGGIELTLKEIDASIWDMDAGFSATDPAPNTQLLPPWDLPEIEGFAVSSGTAALLQQADGTIIPRILAEWTAQTDPRIAQDGRIELRWGLAVDAETSWQSRTVPGGATQEYLTGVREGLVYIVKARTVGALATGPWCVQVAELVLGKSEPPSDPTGFTGAVVKGVITWTWDACQDIDYADTEVRAADSAWGTAAPEALFKGKANGWQEVTETTGDITRHIRHFDTSGNDSATTASYTLTVTDADLPGGASAVLQATPETIQVPVDAAGVADFSAAISTLAVLVADVNEIADWTIGKTDHGVTSTLSGTHDETLTITGYDPAQISADYRAVVLQCHFDGDASDSSQYHRTAAVGSGVTFAAGVFGQAAVFPGGLAAVNKLRFESPDLRLRGKFTIRFRLRLDYFPNGSQYSFCGSMYHGRFLATRDGGGNGSISWEGFIGDGDVAIWINSVGSSYNITTGTQYAIELTRDDGGMLRLFIDGELVKTGGPYTRDPKATYPGVGLVDMGYGYTNGSSSSDTYNALTSLIGAIDEYQLMIGVCAHTAAFTPETSPFSDSTYLSLGYVDVTATKAAQTATKRVQVLSTAAAQEAVTAKLSPAAWVAPASATGAVSSYASSGTTWSVASAGRDVSASWSGVISATSEAGVTATLTGQSLAITAFPTASDTGWVEITLSRAGYASQVLQYSLSKSKAGDFVELRASQATIYVHAYSSSGHVPSFSGASSTLAVIRNGTDETSSWTVTINSSAHWSASVSSATVTLTALDDATDTDAITATLTRSGYPTMVKTIGIAKIKDLTLGGVASIGVVDLQEGGSLTLATDGSSVIDIDALFSFAGPAWYAPAQSGIGSSYWIRVTELSSAGSPSYSGPTVSTWVALSSAAVIDVSGGGDYVWAGKLEIATSSGGAGAVVIGGVSASRYTPP